MTTSIRLSDILSPAFVEPHNALKSGEYNQIVATGGRGSCKSSWASVEGVLLLLKNPDIHGVVMRKVGNTLRNTVYAQYIWAITVLGIYDKFKCTVSPMELIYKPTGQKLMFFGADDPGKLKSMKVPFGYVGYLHFEELDQFAGEAEIRNFEQSVLRGGPLAYEIKTFNPPRTKDNWANKYCRENKPGQLIHHSTFRTTPKEWLGQRFLDDEAYLRATNPAAAEHEYDGIPNGTGGMVFDNVVDATITDEQIASFDRIYNGVDWGWYPDPWAFTRSHLDMGRRTLYIFDEAKAHKSSNQATAEIVKGKVLHDEVVTCDSAENKSVGDYVSFGVRARGAIKGPGSVEYSMKWLQSLNAIVIDRQRCPNTYAEFAEYEYERDKDGNVISGYPDANNHFIDATRYALERVWRRRGQ